MSNTFSAPERAAFKKLLDVAHASQPELGAAIGRLENGGTALSRSYVSQVLGGGRGSDNLDVAERFRRGALGLIEAFLKKSGPLTARSVQDFLHDLRRELSDEELADDMVKALLTRLASLSPEPPKSAYDSTTALPDDARDLVETAALRAAVAHATSQPYFNLHISGPRFSGISTVARAVAAAVKRNSPEALVCYFDCAPDVQQFSAEFVRRLGGAAESPGDDAARIKEFLARLWGELVAGLELPKSALELDLPIPADGFSVPRELLVAVKSRMKGLESAPFRQRVVILDSNDPTDVPLAKAIATVAVGLNDISSGPRGISVVVCTSYSAELLGKLEPSARSSSKWVSERFHQIHTGDFSEQEAGKLADALADENPVLADRLKTVTGLKDLPGGQPMLTCEAMQFLRDAILNRAPAERLISPFNALTANRLTPTAAPVGIRAFMAEIERVNRILNSCGIALDPASLSRVNDDFALAFLHGAGWAMQTGKQRTYRWQALEEAWATAKN